MRLLIWGILKLEVRLLIWDGRSSFLDMDCYFSCYLNFLTIDSQCLDYKIQRVWELQYQGPDLELDSPKHARISIEYAFLHITYKIRVRY